MSASAAASPSADYGLPVAGDVPAWERVMRPCTGCLQLYKAALLSGGGVSRRRSPTLVAVTVWVHCGLHYQPLRQQAGAACTPPSPGGMPPLDRPEKHFGFFPLRRDEPGLDPFVSVRFFCAAPGGGEVRGVDGRWVVELVDAADAGHPLRFCAASQADAAAWARQLRMRSAPLTAVWSRHVGVLGSGSGSGGGIGAARGGPDGPSRLAAVAALQGGARQVLANDMLAGVAGVVAELTQPQAHNVAVGAGPLVGVAFGALGFALRVFEASRSVFGAAAGVSDGVDDLHRRLCRHVLPALRDLRADGAVDVGDVMHELARLVSSVEVLAGELHHLVRSRRQRAWLACVATQRGVEVGAEFSGRLDRCRERADELVQLTQVELLRRVVKDTETTRIAVIAAAPMTVAQQAARGGLPPLPPHLFNDWENPQLPAAQLYEAVMKPGSTTCTAVGAHGMGGVGKTLSCLLVAHRVVREAAGRARFPDGVHWVQLSDKVGDADVKQRVCDLATTLSGHLAVANELTVAVKHLRAALRDKSCLLIVDDIWDDRWAAAFIGAVRSAAGPCLLLSSRRQDIATRTNVSQSVVVDTLRGAAAAGVLMVYAEAGHKVWSDKTDHRVELALDACGGLALALAVMGSLVHQNGWRSAVERISCERDSVFDMSLDVVDVVNEYKGSLWACLLASYRALDADEQLLWRARFQALCVVRSKEKLPWTALAALWGENEPMAVKRIAQTLRDRSLLTLHGEEDGETLCLSLHDLVIEFLAGPHIMGQEQREGVHVRMVAKYCERSGVRAAETPTSAASTSERMPVRALWQLPSDGFVERALPRLLCACGAGGRAELRTLLFDWRFIAWRVEVGSGGCDIYRMDGHNFRMDGCIYREHGVLVTADVLDCLVNVVESAVAVKALPLSPRLQQAAWEVTERFASRLHMVGGEAAAPLLAHLRDTARLWLAEPAVSLYGAFRLCPPQERWVFGCGEDVDSLCRVVSSSGEVLLVVGQGDGKLLIWEVRNGSRVAVLDGHTLAVTCLAVLSGGGSSGGGRVVSGSSDGTVRVWEVDGGKCVVLLEGHTDHVRCLAVLDGGGSGSGGRVVSGSRDGTLRVWNVDGGRCVAVLEGHSSWVSCLAVLEGGRVVSGSGDGTVRVWETDGDKRVAVLEGHSAPVTCLGVLCEVESGGEERIVSGSDDGTVRVWKVDDGGCVAVLAGHSESVSSLAVLTGSGSGGGRRIVSGSADGTGRLWDVDAGKCVAVLKGHTSWVRCVAELVTGGSGGSGQVMSGSGDGTVRVWDVDGGKCVAVLEGHTKWVRFLVALDGGGSSSDKRVVSGSADGTVRVWHVHGHRSLPVTTGHTAAVRCLVLLGGGESDGGGRIVSGSDDGTVRVWEADGGKCVAVLKGHSTPVTCLAALNEVESGGGGRVVAGASDGTLRVWDVDGRKCVAVLKHVFCVALMECGMNGGGWRVVCGSNDCTVRVWDVDGGTCVAELEGHTSRVRCLAVLGGGGGGGGGRVVSGSDDGTVRVWRVDGGECVAVLEGHSASVRCLTVLDGGGSGSAGRIVSGSEDHTVRVWNTGDDQCVAVLEGHARPVVYLAVLHTGECGGGRRIVSGSDDGTVRVWQVDDGMCVAELHDLGLPLVAGAAVSPLLGPFAHPATTFWHRYPVTVDLRGMCALYDRSGHLRYLPGPPSATALCTVSPGRFAWGTSSGRVFFGRLGS